MEQRTNKTTQKKRAISKNKGVGITHQGTVKALQRLSSKSEADIERKQANFQMSNTAPEDVDSSSTITDADDVTIENLNNEQSVISIQQNYSQPEFFIIGNSPQPINLAYKTSKVKFKEGVEDIGERHVNVLKSRMLSHKLSESFPLLKMVCDKEKKIVCTGDASEHSSEFEPQDILDYLTDPANFDITLSESFIPEAEAYSAALDPWAQKFYQLMCIRDNIRPLPIILTNLEKKKFELHQYSLCLRMFEIAMEALKNNRGVEVLELTESQIDNARVIAIANMLEKNITIFSLDLSRNCIGKEGITALSEVLDVSYCMACLYLSENSLRNRDVAPLIKNLQSNYFLTTLDLSYNKITFEYGQDLIAFLTNNETLINLDLRWCLICDKGGLALAKGLKRNVSLKVLDISWNGLGDRGLKSLALALAYNSCLKAINLANNNLTAKSTVQLARALKRNKSLEILILDNNSIYDDNIKTLIQLCLNHTTLLLLSLQGVHVDKKTAYYIEEMQYLASEDTFITKIVLQNDYNDMHVVNETLVRSFLKLLFEFIKQNGPSLDAAFKSNDKSKCGYLGIEATMLCLEKTGFHIPLKSSKDLITKIAKENLESIPYCIFFDDTISKILSAHRLRLKRFAAVAKYL